MRDKYNLTGMQGITNLSEQWMIWEGIFILQHLEHDINILYIIYCTAHIMGSGIIYNLYNCPL